MRTLVFSFGHESFLKKSPTWGSEVTQEILNKSKFW